MATKNRPVTIKVDRNYFENFFEPERRRLSSKLGINLTQAKMTAYIASSGAKLKYPKNNMKYFGYRKKRGGFSSSLGIL